MSTSPEIALYWAWHIERAQLIGHVLQVLAFFFLVALWWHGERGWRTSRWLLIAYFCIIGFLRYAVWLMFGFTYDIRSDAVRDFIARSGAAGLGLCILSVVFLALDITHRWVRFDDFSPESWRRSRPSAAQWFGLVTALFALWSPFVPHPAGRMMSLFTWGLSTSFGTTLTPTLLMLGGLTLAGSRKPSAVAAAFFGIGTVISSIGSDPLTVHGAAISALGIAIAVTGWIFKGYTGGRKIASAESLVQ